ncbi:MULTISPECIES: SDR family oxidoreductase [Zhongshania]|uniref:SDR family oxidoreductase n=1 Tax=Zhongshania aquimaris TaxID=2857107 RepID=A0ABS6VQX8_9GAMM|nr:MULTISPECIES: SDR family oxidoreductase [Zhongshania]MBQ0795882.1 SDR family oxidoreductase [Zhongshania sp.]MBW2940712.1 SDR family oxidoreductase [Zhongshania aquimaris]
MGSKRVFITGGASGLGRALANRFADAGYSVCIGDVDDGRGAEALAELKAKGQAHYVNCDVTKEHALQSAADWLLSNWGGVDIVINNAGVASAGGIAEFSMDDWEWIVNINLLGVVRGCKVFTRLMREQGSGHIVNIASLAGLIYPPKMASYCATKAAVVALSETMSLELDADNINVSVVCPSFFRTNLAESVRASDADSQAATQRLVNKAKLGADEIAGRVFNSIEKGEFYILPHPEGRSIWRLKRWLPFKRYRAMMLKQTARMMTNKRKG